MLCSNRDLIANLFRSSVTILKRHVYDLKQQTYNRLFLEVSKHIPC